MRKIEMQFLPDVYVRCDECKGKRYNSETLKIKYKGKTVSDILDMTVEEAFQFFSNISIISKKLRTLMTWVLDMSILASLPRHYRGRSQRIKIAAELSKEGYWKNNVHTR